MPTTYNFTGQRLDSETGLLYYNFRYYDPVSGRFVRADTVDTNAKGIDPFAYVGDSPEGRTDPTGHCFPFCLVTAVIGVIVGASVGIISEAATHGTNFGQYNWGHVAVDAAVGGVAGFMIGTGVGAAVGIGMITGGATSLIGSVASHKSFGEVVQSTFEGAAIGGIMGGVTAGVGEEFGLSTKLMFRGINSSGIGRTAGQGLLQAAGGMVGDGYNQLWDSRRSGDQHPQFNWGETITSGAISFGAGFLGEYAYNHLASWPSGLEYTSRVSRQIQSDANWAMQSNCSSFA